MLDGSRKELTSKGSIWRRGTDLSGTLSGSATSPLAKVAPLVAKIVTAISPRHRDSEEVRGRRHVLPACYSVVP